RHTGKQGLRRHDSKPTCFQRDFGCKCFGGRKSGCGKLFGDSQCRNYCAGFRRRTGYIRLLAGSVSNSKGNYIYPQGVAMKFLSDFKEKLKSEKKLFILVALGLLGILLIFGSEFIKSPVKTETQQQE